MGFVFALPAGAARDASVWLLRLDVVVWLAVFPFLVWFLDRRL